MQFLSNFLNDRFVLAGIYTNKQILYSVGIMVLAYIFFRIVRFLIIKKMKKESTPGENDRINRIIERIGGPIAIFIYLCFFYIAIDVLHPLQYKGQIHKAIFILIAIDTTWLFLRLTDIAIKKVSAAHQADGSLALITILPLISHTIKAFILTIGFILVVHSLGYSVTSLLAGLGIGGLAVALAAKDTLANIFGSITIFLDKPFIIGDSVIINNIEGIIEDIGFRSTWIRTSDSNLVSIPNSIVSNQAIQNLSKKGNQRIELLLKIDPSNSPEKILEMSGKMKEIIIEHPDTLKEPVYSNISDITGNSIGITISFLINSGKHSEFLKVRHEICYSIYKLISKEDIKLAGAPATLPDSPKTKNNTAQFNPEPAQIPGMLILNKPLF